MPAAGFAAVAVAAAAPGPLVQADGVLLQIGAGWRVLTLPRQQAPATVFSPERLDGRPAVRVDARGSYGHLAHAWAGPSPAGLSWSWRVDLPNASADLRRKTGDDSPAKVCLSFDLPLDRVPFFERELLRLARTRSPEPLPAATLCWVWSHADAPGAVLPNAYSRRVRYIVLRSKADAPGHWFEEIRDVRADFLAAFGDESATVPPVVAVLVGGDADNTGATSRAYVAGLEFIPAAGK